MLEKVKPGKFCQKQQGAWQNVLDLNAFCDISLLQWNSTTNSEKLTRILQYFKQQSLIWEATFE